MNNFTKENFLNYIKFSEKLISKRSAERRAAYKETEKYYADAYDAVVLEKKIYYWNGYAALFGFFWLLHRRMYFEAFLSLMVLGILELFIPCFFPMKSMPHLIFSFALYGPIFLAFGFFGTPLYIRCIKERIEANKILPHSPVDWSVIFLAAFLSMIIPFIMPFVAPEIMPKIVVNVFLLALCFFKYARAYSQKMV